MLLFRIEAPVSALYRQSLSSSAHRLWNAEINFSHREDALDQRLDVETGATLAALVLQIVGMLIMLSDRHEGRGWTLERVERSVREEAAKALGTEELEHLRYHQLREFLDGRSATCEVTAEVDDELHLFVVFKDGSTVIVRYDS